MKKFFKSKSVKGTTIFAAGIFAAVFSIPVLIFTPPVSNLRVGIAVFIFVLLILFLDGNPRKILRQKKISKEEISKK